MFACPSPHVPHRNSFPLFSTLSLQILCLFHSFTVLFQFVATLTLGKYESTRKVQRNGLPCSPTALPPIQLSSSPHYTASRPYAKQPGLSRAGAVVLRFFRVHGNVQLPHIGQKRATSSCRQATSVCSFIFRKYWHNSLRPLLELLLENNRALYATLAGASELWCNVQPSRRKCDQSAGFIAHRLICIP